MKDIITVSVVNFKPVWGDIEANLSRMLEYAAAAGKQGADLILFPETAMTGYDDELSVERDEKMHRRLAQTIPGPASNAMSEICKKYNIYALFGLTETDETDKSKVYNAAAICGPEGVIGSYRKIHIPSFESQWADPGDWPVMFDTPWGPMGIGICYDSYAFPEITRYCRAKGARLFLNLTAIASAESGGPGGYTGNLSLEYHAHNNSMYIATSNLFGQDKRSWFMGGSSIIGPASRSPEIHYYAGKKFMDPGADQGTVETATIDLSLTDLSFLAPVFTERKWRPADYIEWLRDVSCNKLL